MNWKLILLLGLFGFVIGIGTVFFIPSSVEPIFWLVTFIFSAYVIAKTCPNHRFFTGLLVGLLDSLIKTSVHMAFFAAYVNRHPQEMAMVRQMTTAVSPRILILLSSPVWGVLFGIVIGLLAMLLGTFIKPAKVRLGPPPNPTLMSR